MPLTPYHVGPALLVALLLYPLLDIPAFIVASLAVDFEPLLWMLDMLPWSMHGRFHSFTLGTPVGLIVAGLFVLYRRYYKPIWLPSAFAQEPGWKKTVMSSVAGVWGHVLLDAFVHGDVNLLWPVQGNPLYQAVDYSTVINFCIISLPLALIMYMIRSTLRAGNISKDKDPVEEMGTRIPDEEPFLYDPGPPIPDYPFADTSPIIYEPEPVVVEPEPEPMPFDFFTSPPEAEEQPEEPEPEEELITGGISPEIFLGVDGTPVQWGLIGKSGIDRVAVDLNEPHIVFLCGKQGSGKGYSMGVITEMLLSKTIPGISQVKKPATVIVFHKPREDLRSEFWSIVEPNLNSEETSVLREEYKISPRRVINGNNVRVFVDPFVYENERSKFRGDYGAEVYPIAIKPQRLTAEDWPYVLSIGRKSGSM